MGKLSCKCGHVIRDTHYNLPYKGHVRRDQDDEYSFDVIAHELALLTEAVASGQRDEWIDRNFLPGYPHDDSTERLISSYLSSFDERFVLQIFECDNYGRLWVQEQPQANTYSSYSPDSGTLNRVLASTRPVGPPIIDGQQAARSQETTEPTKDKPSRWMIWMRKRFGRS